MEIGTAPFLLKQNHLAWGKFQEQKNNSLIISPQLQKHTHTHPFNGLFSETIRVSRQQKGKTNLDFTEATDSEWQWHQLGHMQVCTSFQIDNHASTPPISFLQAECSSCCPTNSVKALKAIKNNKKIIVKKTLV